MKNNNKLGLISKIAIIAVFSYETFKVHFRKESLSSIDYILVFISVVSAFYFTRKQRKERGY